MAKFMMTVLIAALTAAGCAKQKPAAGADLMSIDVSNRRSIAEVVSAPTAGTYAKSNSYYGYQVNQLKAGMTVLFSASYGADGGEAGQSRGVLVTGKDGGLYYKQRDNTTSQLLLPPGLSLDGQGDVSLWEMRSYLDLINRVAFNESQRAASETDVYKSVSAYKVDFEGGTASASVSYKDAMELKLEKSNADSVSNVSLYFAKSVGSVALEFRETGAVGGTFKIYIGEKDDAASVD